MEEILRLIGTLAHTHMHTDTGVKCMAILIDLSTMGSHFSMMDSKVEVFL